MSLPAAAWAAVVSTHVSKRLCVAEDAEDSSQRRVREEKSLARKRVENRTPRLARGMGQLARYNEGVPKEFGGGGTGAARAAPLLIHCNLHPSVKPSGKMR